MKIVRFLSVLLFVVVLFSTSCVQPKKSKPTITVSVLPQKYFADQIVGNKMDVMCMIPAGSNPESYDPSPNQLIKLNKSLAYMAVGNLGFELAWLNKLKQNHPELKLVDTSDSISLIIVDEHSDTKNPAMIDHNHIGPDPHTWSSPKSSRILATNIYKAVIDIDAKNKKYYTANFTKLLAEIDSTDSQITRKLKMVKNRSFLIYHPALTYLAHDYGLDQYSVEFNGKEPTPQHLKSLINVAQKEKIKVIFVQKEFDVKNAAILAKETGCRVVQIDPLNYKWAKGLTDIVDALVE
ncbi:MAG: zinc ABC transporter substrate-binding protein [Bacteroidales bacterium]|nr:zinc ABC transporter substrate-binding protein [Bacteroidales bacterium]